jgi:hypothetical protein
MIFQHLACGRGGGFFAGILEVLRPYLRFAGKSILAFGSNMLNHALPDIFLRCPSRLSFQRGWRFLFDLLN